MLWCVDPVDPVLLMLVYWGKRSRQFYWNAYQRAAGLLNTLQRFGFGVVVFLQTYGSLFPFLLKHNNNSFICCPPNGAAES